MSDLINRQDAIDAINHICPLDTEYDCTLLDRVDVRCVLSELPSAERKRGEWQEVYAETDYRNGWIEFSCEFCEYQHGLESGEYDWHYGDRIPWKFCPCCGAEMRERREDEC